VRGQIEEIEFLVLVYKVSSCCVPLTQVGFLVGIASSFSGSVASLSSTLMADADRFTGLGREIGFSHSIKRGLAPTLYRAQP